MTIRQGIRYSNGFESITSVLFLCIILIIISIICKVLFLILFFLLAIIIDIILLLLRYKGIRRIIDNQIILHTKIIECKSTYDSGEFVFKIEKGPIYMLSSYFENNTGQTYMFETFCISEPFKNVPRYRIDYGNSVILALDSIDVCVNKNNYREYFFLLDSFNLISNVELEIIKNQAEGRRDISLNPMSIDIFNK